MASNRIQSHLASASAPATSPQVTAAPQQPQPVPPGFAVCPPHLMSPQAWQAEIYRQAYERARAAAQIPTFHRRLFCVWN